MNWECSTGFAQCLQKVLSIYGSNNLQLWSDMQKSPVITRFKAYLNLLVITGFYCILLVFSNCKSWGVTLSEKIIQTVRAYNKVTTFSSHTLFRCNSLQVLFRIIYLQLWSACEFFQLSFRIRNYRGKVFSSRKPSMEFHRNWSHFRSLRGKRASLIAPVEMWNVIELPSSQLDSFVLCFEIDSVVNVYQEDVAIALVVRLLHYLRTYVGSIPARSIAVFCSR